jgi:DNA-binding NarL/FixJ family response regulator
MRLPDSRTLRVVVAGDTSVRTDELAETLATHAGIDVVGLARGSRETLDLVETLSPHAVLIDLAKAIGPEAMTALRTLGARVIVVADSDHGDRGAGADGIVAGSPDLANTFFAAASLALGDCLTQ